MISCNGKSPEDFRALAQKILHYAASGVSRIEFLREITRMLLESSECDSVEFRVKKDDKCFRCEAVSPLALPPAVEISRHTSPDENVLLACSHEWTWFEKICRTVAERQYTSAKPFFTKHGSFRTGKLDDSLSHLAALGIAGVAGSCGLSGDYRSLTVIPLVAGEDTIGLLALKSKSVDRFDENETAVYENLAQTLGLALASQQDHVTLRERVKELTCLYSLAQLAERPHVTLDEILQGIVELLPPAWQYPEITAARIILDGRAYSTPNFQKAVHVQSSDIVVEGEPRGVIEVMYSEERIELDEGPFLKEERSLINTLARQIALIIRKRQADEDRAHLQEQLRHADRLATIGQLAAGVAHELNEPLASILGFAQLAEKHPCLPDQVSKDIRRIVTTALYAREIVKKLMLFARQTPPRTIPVNLNKIVADALGLLESRCAENDIMVMQHLSADLPEITADPSQIHQVLINLAVNAIQAMPNGGTLTIGTQAENDWVILTVQDTGVGMTREVLRQLFIPFFTTKDIHEGTGLGLPVVHGIVTSHGGKIHVQSAPGKGARFEIRFPAPDRSQDNDHNADPLVI
ncbi:MAG TPA: ATP-binding protein [bacterium]|nr:ATP-binding protein [bacterium]HQL63133.1 ATP-binding protein [bacterium]